MDIKFSVVIPVYNVEKYLARAIDSVLLQDEVDDIILVEDASPDNALKVCKYYEKKHKKVSLYRHPNNENKGAGATRNLGIEKAKNEWVAFLDADDYYLPNRFRKTVETINRSSDIDGVYEAVRNGFENEIQKEKFLKTRPKNFSDAEKQLNFHVFKEVPPEMLFNTLIKGSCGFIHLNGLSVKKSLVKTCGMFDPQFRIMQDTYLIYKLSAIGKLYNGGLEHIVAERVLHDNNRITHVGKREMVQSRISMFENLLTWAISKKVDSQILNDINWKIAVSEMELGKSSFIVFIKKLIRKINFSL